ncbi:MAG: hypothetical protein HZB71_05525 [Betaproteobacteria bacterium]|nr:hypothetical protein [Betaproteobacteria bacterium]
MNLPLRVLVGPCLLVMAVSSHAASLGALMKSAIDAPDGRASGVLNDAVAGLIAKTTGSAAPVVAQIETLSVFRQAGCRRLMATLSQPAPGQPDAVFPFEMNLCRDGSAPREGMDLEQLSGKFGVPQSVR